MTTTLRAQMIEWNCACGCNDTGFFLQVKLGAEEFVACGSNEFELSLSLEAKCRSYHVKDDETQQIRLAMIKYFSTRRERCLREGASVKKDSFITEFLAPLLPPFAAIALGGFVPKLSHAIAIFLLIWFGGLLLVEPRLKRSAARNGLVRER